MSLQEYRRKRSFDRTREPEPGKAAPPGERAIFVVQLHHASRRHYDFRLQVGDALKSWAVPKGPSFDPKVKRLAAEVEDHPLDYAGFEGEIPKGEYGGGHVALFDRGYWSTDGEVEAQLAKGHLRFELFGERLRGAWHLVRSRRGGRKPEWLLFKAEDCYAAELEADDLLQGVTPPPDSRPRDSNAGRNGASSGGKRPDKSSSRKAAVAAKSTKSKRQRKSVWAAKALKLGAAKRGSVDNAAFDPQLARLGDKPPSGSDWLHELKWDGYRLLVAIDNGEVRLWSRNALEWTDRLPDVAAALQQLELLNARLDGELIAGAGAQADFGLLQATLSGEQHAPLSLVLFDLLHIDGVDVDAAPLIERKKLLAELLTKPPRHLAYSSHIEDDGEAAFRLAAEKNFEGIISKRGSRPYRPGRGDDWRKSKRLHSDEYAVVGFTAPKGQRSGFGSLLLAQPDAEHGWRYAGRVGSGFSDRQLADISRGIGRAGAARPSVHVDATDTDLRSARWFAPRFVVEVFSRGTGNQGLLRQPSLKAIRLDKEVTDLATTDTASSGGRTRSAAKKNGSSSATASSKGASRTSARVSAKPSAEGEPVRISSPERVVFPDSGITKQQVADYYRGVMDHLLPEVIGRPLSVIRCPDGSEGACFFQKHHTAGLKRVETVRLKEESGRAAMYLVVDDAEGLMELVQFNALEFHPWGACAASPDQADRVVFDLDPGPGVSWPEVKRAAVQVRDLLAKLDLVSFVRLTGGKGLHVVLPLKPGCDWPLVKRFAHGFADSLAQSEPQRFVAVASKAKRNRRIFIDYLRNTRGATSVASYSLRARPGAPAAVPLAWSELSRIRKPDAYDLSSLPRRLTRLKQDPWAGIDDIEQDLSRWSEED